MEISLGQINDLTSAVQEFSSQSSIAFDNIIAKVGEMFNELNKISTMSTGSLWDDIRNGTAFVSASLLI